MKNENETRESLANVQHQIWAHWMKYLFSVATRNSAGNWEIPADKVLRWQRQADMPYALLSEKEKESDREQADKVLNVLSHLLGAGK